MGGGGGGTAGAEEMAAGCVAGSAGAGVEGPGAGARKVVYPEPRDKPGRTVGRPGAGATGGASTGFTARLITLPCKSVPETVTLASSDGACEQPKTVQPPFSMKQSEWCGVPQPGHSWRSPSASPISVRQYGQTGLNCAAFPDSEMRSAQSEPPRRLPEPAGERAGRSRRFAPRPVA